MYTKTRLCILDHVDVPLQELNSWIPLFRISRYLDGKKPFEDSSYERHKRETNSCHLLIPILVTMSKDDDVMIWEYLCFRNLPGRVQSPLDRCRDFFLEILASTYDPGPYDPVPLGHYGPGPLIILKNIRSYICSRAIFDLEFFFRLWMVQDRPYTISRGKNLQKAAMTRAVTFLNKRAKNWAWALLMHYVIIQGRTGFSNRPWQKY